MLRTLTTGLTICRPRYLLPAKTFCESEQCCEVSPKLGNLALELAETVLVGPLRDRRINPTHRAGSRCVTCLDPSDRFAGHTGPGT